MVHHIHNVMRDVRVAIDQNTTSRQLLASGDVDTLSLDEVIRSKIEEAAGRVEKSAPAYLLEEGHCFGDTIFWGEHESGWTLLPDDFMRLVTFRMSDWERTVYSAISANDPLYALQSSRYKGIRGNAQKPICAIVNRPEGKVLEFYSCKSRNAKVDFATYIPYPRIDENDGIDISERCYTAVVYMIASLVLRTFGEMEPAAAMNELCQSCLA